MPRLSVNILTWNTYPTLVKTLEILKEDLKGIDHEIIIVDNASTDGCQELATIKNKTNLGTAVGKNQGIKASAGDYIFLLDGDVVPVANTVPLMVEFLNKSWDVDAIGFCRNKFSTEGNKYGKKHEDYCKTLANPRLYDYVCLYYGMFRRGVFDLISCDENYSGEGYGWEDRDLWEQFKRAGLKQYVADINDERGRYFHAINSSVRNMGHQKMMESGKIRHDYFMKKWKVGQYAH
jgi:glycosyltransferase involved in cell wall biosynthesis